MMVFIAYLEDFLIGLWNTAYISALSFAGGLALGVLGALGRRSRSGILRQICALYVELMRNTPTLVLLYFVYFGLPAVEVHVPAVLAGVIALALNAGAYLTEIIRAGFESIPESQRETARTLGISRMDTFFLIVLPQATRAVYRPVVTEFIQSCLLGSAVVSVIAVNELTATALIVNGITFKTMEVFATALALYLILSNLIAVGADALGGWLFKAPLAGAVARRRRQIEKRQAAMGGGG